jgi:PleD family two-component response regulator
MSSRLRMMGYATEMSASGFQAIHLLEAAQKQKKSYRLILIVGDSEDMPGREILLLMRNINESKKSLPILYVHKDKDPDEILNIMKEGANDYIVEGPNDGQIVTKIKKYAPLET